jgi:CMP-2-keto-3-deoxyoctulosonic acid synthetase
MSANTEYYCYIIQAILNAIEQLKLLGALENTEEIKVCT